MTRTGKWMGAVGVLVLAATAGALLLAGCNGGGGKGIPKSPKATSYLCEECKYVFGIPTDTPMTERIYPPMVCPQCSKRAAVQAFYYEPKAGGKPDLYKMLKYSDEQIRAFEAYIKSLPADSKNAPSPEEALAAEGFQTLEKYPGTDKWLRTWGDKPEGRPPLTALNEIRDKYKSIIPVFDKDWPIKEAKEIKQW